jgi:pimeloyl-ACP methyl ester carboxylesterase
VTDYARARDGARIFWSATGTGPAVVLSDGIGCDGYVWKYLEPELAHPAAGGRAFRSLRWHYRGHGRSPVPEDRDRVSIADLADDLASVLDAAGVDRAVFAGHSMGVQVSLEAWRRHPDRCAGLILICGSYGKPLRTFKRSAALEYALPAVRSVVAMAPNLARRFVQAAVPTDLSYKIATMVEINPDLARKEDFFPYLEGIAAIDPALFLGMLAHAGRHSARPYLDAIDVPTLIVAGLKDGFTPSELSEEMHRKIAGSEMVVIEDGSHTAPIERPEIVNPAVRSFLERRVFSGA